MASDSNSDALIAEQIRYYNERAPEYDEWFVRAGRYDRGKEANDLWFAEIETVVADLKSFLPNGKVLEIAPGTGNWTIQYIDFVDTLTAVDSSAEMLVQFEKRLFEYSSQINTIQADIFRWKPPARYNVVFFSFLLSHVPRDKFEAFWEMVRSALDFEGRVYLIDSLYNPGSTAWDHELSASGVEERKLNNGRRFNVIKNFYTRASLAEALNKLGWDVSLKETPNFFLYGQATPM